MSEAIQVLIVDDSEADALLLVEEIEKEHFAVTYERVETAAEMRSALERSGWQLILCDYCMPTFDALGALETYRASDLDIPFIVVSGYMGEQTAVAVMRAGAHDYLLKDNLLRLGSAISRELREAENRLQRRQALKAITESEKRLQEQARLLREALHYKTTLVQENHHRVRNNLQVILSLLAMQANTPGQVFGPTALTDAQRRVHSVALVHDLMNGREDAGQVSLLDIIQRLVHSFQSEFEETALRVKIDVNAPAIEIGVDQAIPCALVVNEVLCNSFRHAFPDDREGSISVNLSVPKADTLEIQIVDDGVGLPDGLNWKKTSTVGLTIVRILARQLHAALSLQGDQGTRFELSFPAMTETKRYAQAG